MPYAERETVYPTRRKSKAMITQERLLLDKLEGIYNRANEANTEKPFFIALYEYLNTIYSNPILLGIKKTLIDIQAKETAQLGKLESQSREEIHRAFKQIVKHAEENKINNETITNYIKDYMDYFEERKNSSNARIIELYRIVYSILLCLMHDKSTDYSPFVSQFGAIKSDGTNRKITWNFSNSFPKWERENDRIERIKLTTTWHSWQQADLFYAIYRDFEAMKDSLLEQNTGMGILGLMLYYGEIEDILNGNKSSRTYFIFEEYKIHLQKIHSWFKEKLMGGIKSYDELIIENPPIPGNKTNEISWGYDSLTGIFSISGKNARFKKNMFRAKVLELLTKNNSNRRKKWEWDEICEKIQGEIEKDGKGKVYEACKGIVDYIASKTGITEFILFDTNTARINPSFLP
jgi:hypothetical protein